MTTSVNDRGQARPNIFALLLRPSGPRLEFATRLAVIAALTTLLIQIYGIPEGAVAVYMVFFMNKADRVASIVGAVVFLILISIIIAFLFLVTILVLEQQMWRLGAMFAISLILTFLASSSKLKPLGAVLAMITMYALDNLGKLPIAELATRGLLYQWLVIAFPAGVTILVNLAMGPAPRHLAELALAARLKLAADLLEDTDPKARKRFEEIYRESLGQILGWIKLAGLEKTSPPAQLAAVKRASESTAALMALVRTSATENHAELARDTRVKLADTFRRMAGIFEDGGYPTDINTQFLEGDIAGGGLSGTVARGIKENLEFFAEGDVSPPGKEDKDKNKSEDESEADAKDGEKTEEKGKGDDGEGKKKAKGGFFVPDAFTNPEHLNYALKTTLAAWICYLIYSLLDWPDIHTALITCYIVAQGTVGETSEKLTLRIIGCLAGAALGIGAIVFVMPHLTSIGGLMLCVFAATMLSAWIAGGSERIGYAGFQIAFAFYMCVIQGEAPAFDMEKARDRIIGILVGNIVTFLIFRLFAPVSVSRRIDASIADLVKMLAGMVSGGTRAKVMPAFLGAVVKRSAIASDVTILRYEPPDVRPDDEWIQERADAVTLLASLEGPLLLAAEQSSNAEGVKDDLLRLAGEAQTQPGTEPREPEGSEPPPPTIESDGIEGSISSDDAASNPKPTQSDDNIAPESEKTEANQLGKTIATPLQNLIRDRLSRLERLFTSD